MRRKQLELRGRRRDCYGGPVKGEDVDGNWSENKSTCLKNLQLLQRDLFCVQAVPAVQGDHLQHRTHVWRTRDTGYLKLHANVLLFQSDIRTKTVGVRHVQSYLCR